MSQSTLPMDIRNLSPSNRAILAIICTKGGKVPKETAPDGTPQRERLGLHDHLRDVGYAALRFFAGSSSPQAIPELRHLQALDELDATGIERIETFLENSAGK